MGEGLKRARDAARATRNPGLSDEERRAIASLQRLARRWPPSLTLVSTTKDVAGQPETFTCPDCGGWHFILLLGGTLPAPKAKCEGCGACWMITREDGHA
jgi:hypothetical protein